MKPLATFRVYPDHRSLFATVRVYRTIADFRAAIRQEGETFRKYQRGFVQTIEVLNFRGGRCRKTPEFAQLFLIKKFLRTGIITHESFHLLDAYVKRYGERVSLPSSGGELSERPAYLIGRIAQQIVQQCYNRKVL